MQATAPLVGSNQHTELKHYSLLVYTEAGGWVVDGPFHEAQDARERILVSWQSAIITLLLSATPSGRIEILPTSLNVHTT